MKNLPIIFLCLAFASCQFNKTSTQSIGSAPGNEVEIGKKALLFAQKSQIDSLISLFDKSAIVNKSIMEPIVKAWRPTFDYYIFPDKSNIKITKTISKSTGGGDQEFVSIIYPYTDGTDSPTKDFVITFSNEKIVKMELHESRMIKIF